eukprot:7948458-Pyramimonas_sp.AAC.1
MLPGCSWDAPANAQREDAAEIYYEGPWDAPRFSSGCSYLGCSWGALVSALRDYAARIHYAHTLRKYTSILGYSRVALGKHPGSILGTPPEHPRSLPNRSQEHRCTCVVYSRGVFAQRSVPTWRIRRSAQDVRGVLRKGSPDALG